MTVYATFELRATDRHYPGRPVLSGEYRPTAAYREARLGLGAVQPHHGATDVDREYLLILSDLAAAGGTMRLPGESAQGGHAWDGGTAQVPIDLQDYPFGVFRAVDTEDWSATPIAFFTHTLQSLDILTGAGLQVGLLEGEADDGTWISP